MDIIEILVNTAIMALCVYIFWLIFKFLSRFIPTLDQILHFVSFFIRAFADLVKWIVKKCRGEQKEDQPPSPFRSTLKRLDDRFSSMGGFVTFVLFALSAVFVIAVLVIDACITKSTGATIERIFFNTTLGSCLAILTFGASFSPADLIAVGFSSFLASVCMDRAKKVSWYIWLLYSIIFIAMSAILASYLSDIFELVGNWGLSSIDALAESAYNSFWSTLGRAVVLIILCYLALVLAVMTFREYYVSFCYGSISMTVFAVACILLNAFFGDPNYAGSGSHWTEYVMLLFMFAAILAAEFFKEGRHKKTADTPAANQENTVPQ